MSDLARQYPPALHPGLIAGTAASNAAGAGVVRAAGTELTSAKNADLGHDYKDDRSR